MKITITHDFETLEEVEAFLAKLSGTTVTGTTFVASPIVVEPAPQPEKRGRKSKKEQAPPPPAAEPLAQPTVEQAREALDKVFTAKGINTARDLLSRYGAKRVAEIKPEYFAKFIDHAEKVLAGHPEAL